MFKGLYAGTHVQFFAMHMSCISCDRCPLIMMCMHFTFHILWEKHSTIQLEILRICWCTWSTYYARIGIHTKKNFVQECNSGIFMASKTQYWAMSYYTWIYFFSVQEYHSWTIFCTGMPFLNNFLFLGTWCTAKSLNDIPVQNLFWGE